MAVAAHDRDVALGEQVAQIDQNFHVSGEESGGNGLAEEETLRYGSACPGRGS